MKINQIIGLVLFLCVSLGLKIIFDITKLEFFSGIGLLIFGVYIILISVIFMVFIRFDVPKNSKQLKKFEYKGLFNPLWASLVLLIVTLMFILGNINGSVPIFFTIIAFIISAYYFYFWLKVRKYSAAKK